MRKAAALIVAAALLGGCGGSSSSDERAPSGPLLDTAGVARAIEQSIREQRDLAAEVTCPARVRQARGVSFVCEARTELGSTEFAVFQEDDAGNVRYEAAEAQP